jgi:hypothetical protein
MTNSELFIATPPAIVGRVYSARSLKGRISFSAKRASKSTSQLGKPRLPFD